MSLSAISKALRTQVFRRDQGRCVYCRLAQVGQAAVFHINHIIPKSQGGATGVFNLALQCPCCSLHKSDKRIVNDSLTGQAVPLFNPQSQQWQEHFEMDAQGLCHGKTAIGRATVAALHMNDSLPRIARSIQIQLGLLEPSR